MKYIFHLTSPTAWSKAIQEGIYCPSSFIKHGYIPCCTASQLTHVAEKRFPQESKLLILAIEAKQITPRENDTYLYLHSPLPSSQITISIPWDREKHREPPSLLFALNSPILNYDPTPDALIDPGRRFPPTHLSLPEICVLTYFPQIPRLVTKQGTRIRPTASPLGPREVYLFQYSELKVAVCKPAIGAPLAAVAIEELIALGCKIFFLCGGAGTLIEGTEVGDLVLPTGAVRDEGTSYHYLPPSPIVEPSPRAVKCLESVLQREKIHYRKGLTWTTDGLYRETCDKIERYREQGCLTVEMEAAAVFAVARFRRVEAAALLFCADDLSGTTWKSRRWLSATIQQEKAFRLILEGSLEFHKQTHLEP